MSDYSKAYYQANKDKWKKDYDKDKQNALNNKTKQRNRKFVNEYKLKNGCKICGYNKSSSSLHFHHRDPSTKIDAVARYLTGHTAWTQSKRKWISVISYVQTATVNYTKHKNDSFAFTLESPDGRN